MNLTVIIFSVYQVLAAIGLILVAGTGTGVRSRTWGLCRRLFDLSPPPRSRGSCSTDQKMAERASDAITVYLHVAGKSTSK